MATKDATAQRIFNADASLVVDRVIVLEKEPRGVLGRLCRRLFFRFGDPFRFFFGHAQQLSEET